MYLAALAALLASSWAFACPSLSGRYFSCRSTTGGQHGSRDMVVTQNVQNGATFYQVSSINESTQEREELTIIADGRNYIHEQRDPSTGRMALVRINASCRQNVLVMNQSVSIAGQTMTNLVTLMSKQSGVLRLASSGQVMGRPVMDTQLCE